VIVLDSSAVLAIVLSEPEAEDCLQAVESADALAMSAVTLSETLIVAKFRGVEELTRELLEGWGVSILDATPSVASRVVQIYGQWGKGQHPASLNFCDCFSYEAAQSNNCPLLYVGQDFSQTDIVSALRG
jgi:ribonuclease VapC